MRPTSFIFQGCFRMVLLLTIPCLVQMVPKLFIETLFLHFPFADRGMCLSPYNRNQQNQTKTLNTKLSIPSPMNLFQTEHSQFSGFLNTSQALSETGRPYDSFSPLLFLAKGKYIEHFARSKCTPAFPSMAHGICSTNDINLFTFPFSYSILSVPSRSREIPTGYSSFCWKSTRHNLTLRS